MNNYPDKNSIVDTFKTCTDNSSFNSRKKIYENYYGGNYYTGSASQNERFNRDLQDYFDSW